jgi:hypothetical protein
MSDGQMPEKNGDMAVFFFGIVERKQKPADQSLTDWRLKKQTGPTVIWLSYCNNC